MHILLFGGSGQIGAALRHSLAHAATVSHPDSAAADLEQPASLERALAGHRPDIIVNAAAYTAVDQAERDAERARRINGDAVRIMAEYASTNGALLVHYSSDYVFDGRKQTAYTEDDTPNPLNAYGRSKLLAEQAIAASGCQALVLRTSWVYSASGTNFLRTILRLARERDALDVVNDQIGAPTSAARIADVTAQAVAAHRQGRLPAGVYHLSAAGRTSWHGLARHAVQAMRELGIDATLRAERIHPVSSADYPQAAERPLNSLLDSGKLCRALGVAMPHWQADVDATLMRLLTT
ncbi:MAG: dTDP-4-dehydrorhamnose reductase [Candidimonas sp.]